MVASMRSSQTLLSGRQGVQCWLVQHRKSERERMRRRDVVQRTCALTTSDAGHSPHSDDQPEPENDPSESKESISESEEGELSSQSTKEHESASARCASVRYTLDET